MMSEWTWWQARHEDGIYSGGYKTREDAIHVGKDEWCDEGFWITEASNPKIRLSDWVDASETLERADNCVYDCDRASSEYDDGPVFECTPDQEKDLIRRIKAVCDEWQDHHGLAFSVNTFAAMRNTEWIEPEPEKQANAQ